MEAILAHIAAHWVEWLFAAALALLAAAWRTVSARLKEEHDKNEAIGDGVQSLLRESIVSNYNNYNKKGYCPIYAKENIEALYKSYSSLGGNHTAKELYEKMMKLPETKKGDDNAEFERSLGPEVS